MGHHSPSSFLEVAFLRWLGEHLPPYLHPVALEMGVGPVSSKNPCSREGTHMAVSVTLNDQQQVTLRIKPTKHDGSPGRVDGVPAWAFDSSNPPGTLTPAADGLSCVLVPNDVDATINFDITATADVDPGTGVTPITATFHVEVDPSLADNLNPAADEPVDKAPPTTGGGPTP